MTPEFLAYAVGTARAPRAFAHPTTLKTLAEKNLSPGLPAGLYSACPVRLRASSRGVSMTEPDVAPAGVRQTHLTRPGGAGAPPGGNRTPRQELADDASRMVPSEARPGRRQDAASGAPGGALPLCQAGATRLASASGGFASRPRGTIASAPRFPALRFPRGGVEMDDGLPGAAKNTGGGALAEAV